MPRQAILLRGINVGSANRMSMAELTDAFKRAGIAGAQKYLQSGNVVVESELAAGELAQLTQTLIHDRFGFDVPVVVRNAEQIATVIASNPFPQAAQADPKRLQVTFLSAVPDEPALAHLQTLVSGRYRSDIEAISLSDSATEVYAWHPDGVHQSKLVRELTDRKLGVVATARNWTTVLAVHEMLSS